MSSNNIIAFASLTAEQKLKVIEEIKYIFYVSSSVQQFNSEDHKQLFFEKWCGDYITFYSDEFFLYLDQSNKLLGYISGCHNSQEAIGKLRVPAFTLFSDLFQNFPAHLHINFHPDARGKGLGSILVNHYENYLNTQNIKGLQIKFPILLHQTRI